MRLILFLLLFVPALLGEWRSVSGYGPLLPTSPFINVNPAFIDAANIQATGEKSAQCGRVWFAARTGSKSITRVAFRFGTVVKTGGSAMTLSLQDTASGLNPDETQDQTVAIANGDAGFASNTWYRTDVLSANRTVNYGDALCMVLEFDINGRLGSDSVAMSFVSIPVAARPLSNKATRKSGSWVESSQQTNMILEFTDGTFGTLDHGLLAKAINQHTYNVSTAGADEHALQFSVPYPIKVDALWAMVGPSVTAASFDLVLYEGTTALKTCTTTGSISGANATRPLVCPITEQELAANTTYYVSLKPTATSNINAWSIDVDDANHFRAYYGGADFAYATRVDLGSWSAPTATRQLMAGVRISAFQDGGSGGGGGGGFVITH